MTIEERIHQLVLGVPGVATVFSADPAWITVAKHVGALLAPGDEPADITFVACSVEDSTMMVRIRVGSQPHVPAPQLARDVAAEIRALVRAEHPGLDVVAAVEVSAIGVALPAD